MRLYGGAQYHRAMAEFRFVVGGVKCPPITREEIVNACGVEDIHDGTNYSRYGNYFLPRLFRQNLANIDFYDNCFSSLNQECLCDCCCKG